jgi:hypothetical protein
MTGTPEALYRGCVFRAEHDSSYDFWNSPDPRWKLCLAFNATTPGEADDVHYFIATSQVNYFRENPHLLSDVLIIQPNEYKFFPAETAIDFRDLRVVPWTKLQSKGLRILGYLTDEGPRSVESATLGCANIRAIAGCVQRRGYESRPAFRGTRRGTGTVVRGRDG